MSERADARVTTMAPSYEAPAAALPTTIDGPDQIVTARRVAVPRDEAQILQKLKVLAAAAGEAFYYRFPVKTRGGGQDWIEGPSIKCALAAARLYGNCGVDVRAVDQGPNIVFYARFTDYETGFQITRPFQQRRSQQTMKTDADRQSDILFQIASSKSIRNVICNALDVYTNFAFEEAKNNLVDKIGKNLSAYRARLVARYVELGIDLKRVETTIGRVADKWLAHDIARLVAEVQSINDGMADKNEVYPSLDKKPDTAPTKPGLDRFNPPAADEPATDVEPPADDLPEEGAS